MSSKPAISNPLISRVEKQFSRWANDYQKNNIIQEAVADYLVATIQGEPQTICDLGCGSGAIASRIGWPYRSFTAVDFSSQMCDLHPKGEDIELLNLDFNNPDDLRKLEQHAPFDLVIASSALQWCIDLPNVIGKIAQWTDHIAFSIFTANTFKTINEITGLHSILPQSDAMIELVSEYFPAKFEIREYELEFPDALSMLRYIKRSGVSGGEKRLDYAQVKKLIADYPKTTLDFEVLFCSC